MRTPGVVKLEPRGDADVRLAAVSIALQVDVLVFEGPPQPLDEHVVHPSAAAVNRDAHTGGTVRGGEGGTGKLTALVGIEESGSPSAATANALSMVFDSRHASTARLAQSMIATR